MRPIDVELWATAVLEKVLAGQAIEDQKVELKGEWPPAARAARQLAGHANAARGAGLLWLIGVDEDKGIVECDKVELSVWHAQLLAQFDDAVAPNLSICVNVPYDGRLVPALYFETDRAPYVVTVSQGKGVEREIPWRIANGTRSAKRSEVLRLLAPLQQMPDVEVLSGTLVIRPYNHKSGPVVGELDLALSVYIAPQPNTQIVIPLHKCFGVLTIGEDSIKVDIPNITLGQPNRGMGPYLVDRSTPRPPKLTLEGITSDGDQVIMRQPGLMRLGGFAQPLAKQDYMIADANIQVDLCILWAETPLPIRTSLKLGIPAEGLWGRWDRE